MINFDKLPSIVYINVDAVNNFYNRLFSISPEYYDLDMIIPAMLQVIYGINLNAVNKHQLFDMVMRAPVFQEAVKPPELFNNDIGITNEVMNASIHLLDEILMNIADAYRAHGCVESIMVYRYHRLNIATGELLIYR